MSSAWAWGGRGLAGVAVALLTTSCAGPDASSQESNLRQVPPDTEVAGGLAYGQTRSAHLDDAPHGYLLDVAAGDVLSAYATALPRTTPRPPPAAGEPSSDVSIDPTLSLYGPLPEGDDGEGALAQAELRVIATDVRAEDRQSAHVVDHEVERAGRYLLVVSDATGLGGDYRVRLACTGGACAPERIEVVSEACELSPLGTAVYDAARRAEPSRSTVPESLMVSFENRARHALVTGPAIFPAVADEIALAETEVDIAFFVFNHCDAYEETIDALARLEARRIAVGADRPVLVRIVVDAQKAVFNTGSTVSRRVYEGVAALQLDPDYVQVQIATYEHLTLGNLHTKSVVIDGKKVFLGGANVQKQHDYAAPWMDSFYALEGRAAQSYLADFDHAWNKAVKWVCGLDAEDPLACQKWEDAPGAWHGSGVLDPDFQSMALDGACVPTIALTRTAWGGLNNNIDNPQDQGILAAFDAATSVIRLQTPNLNDDAVKDALVRAVARGVEVRIILSLGFNEKAMQIFGGGNASNADELRRRVRDEAAEYADRLDVRFYSADGVAPVEGGGAGASHLKYLSVDGQLAIVGSTNMDTLAWNHSRETNVAVDQASVATAWDAEVFEPNWARAIPR
jgi:phosphatidylserine/phosphatidylglycerophosphate/cardiolipin synthase-like enzyme